MYNLITRLKEPSTYAGLAAAAVAFGISMDEFTIWANAVAAVCALLAIFVQDPGSDS